MSVRLKVYDKELNKALTNATAEGLTRATVMYHTKARMALNVPNTGVRVKVRKRQPGSNKTTRTIYPNPSKPGESPRKRTGWLQRHVVQEIDTKKMASRVGVQKNAIYGLYLELGTKHVARRPWLVATLMKNKAIIAKLLAVGGQGKVK